MNYTPNKPLASSTKENIFPTYEPITTKNQKAKSGEPRFGLEAKSREQENVSNQNSSFNMSAPKQVYPENIMQTYEEKSHFRAFIR
jgi:hypothetical protein